MKQYKITIALVATIVFSATFAILFKWAQTGNPFKTETIMYGAIILVNILIIGTIAHNSFNRFTNQSAKQLQKNIIPSFLIFVVIALFISLSLVSSGVYIYFLINNIDTSNFLHHLFHVELASAIKQFSVWILIGSALFFYIIWRKAIEREHKLREENLKYRYQNLKSQVNPHFLFNSLNTLSEMIYSDVNLADKYIHKLSSIYRYILENEEVDLIPLNREMEFVKQYFELQKVRDNDKIQMTINIQNPEKYKIIPISLQILIENTLKHNARSEKKPLNISIDSDENTIIVSNNIQRKNTLESSSGKGLNNLTERLKLTLKKELTVEEIDNKFIVKLPLIEV